MKRIAALLSLTLLWGCSSSEEEQARADASYAIGYELGKNLALSGWRELDQAALWSGLEAGIAGDDPEAAEKAGQIFNQLQQQQLAQIKTDSEAARIAGSQYLSDYLKQDDSQRTPLGVGYRVIEAGTGSHPQLSDSLQVSYRLETIDGLLIEETAENETLTLLFGQMIPGWEEALRQMRVGELRELIIPPEAGYGDVRFASNVPPGSTLRFRLRLEDITPESER